MRCFRTTRPSTSGCRACLLQAGTSAEVTSLSPDQLVFVINANVILVAKVVSEPAEGWVPWCFLAQRAWVSF